MSNRSKGGLKAKRQGAGFEVTVDRSAIRNMWIVVAIADGCRRISAKKLIQVPQPFDRVYVKGKTVIFCDLKSYDKSTLSYSDCVKFKHQIDKLSELEEHGQTAGFIVYLRKLQTVSFFKASILDKLEKGKSLDVSLGIELGSIFEIDLDQISELYNEV